MKKKRRLKKQLVFDVFNTLVILAIIGFYGYRMVFYYLEFNNNVKNVKQQVLLSSDMIKKVSMLDKNNGLIDNEDGTYTFKGNANNNYIKYSGRIFRALGIDKDKNVTMISEDNQTILIPGINDYETGYLKEWLNVVSDKDNTGIYLNSLNTPSLYLTETKSCLDKIDDIKSIKCEKVNSESLVSLLSLEDYSKIGGSDSYLNNGSDFFLVSQNSKNETWYVAKDGGISLATLLNETHGIRPVVTLNGNSIVYSGDGSKNNPYVIEKRTIKMVNDANVSDYVTLSNYKWQIVEKNNDMIKLVMDGVITKDEENVSIKYGTNSNLSTKSGIFKYLNNDFYNSLEEKDLIVKNKCYYGAFSEYVKYNYQDVYSTSLDCNVGLLNIGDLFVNKYPSVFLSNKVFGDDSIVYTINENNSFFTDFVTSELNVRPVIYIKNTNILSGSGSESDPYTLEVLEVKANE